MNETLPVSTQANAAPQKNGISLIAAERQRQLTVEQWTPEHDAEHHTGDLAMAGACYAVMAKGLQQGLSFEQASEVAYGADDQNWPWGEGWWKPAKDTIRNLEKAGALIAAEIDRLLRKGQTVSEHGGSHAVGASSENPPPSSTELEGKWRQFWRLFHRLRDGDNRGNRASIWLDCQEVALDLQDLTKASSLKKD